MGRLRTMAAFVLVLLLDFPFSPAHARDGSPGRPVRILVHRRSDAAPYRAVVEGFRAGLDHRAGLLLVEDDRPEVTEPFDGETVHFCVGQEALDETVAGPQGRIVAAMVMDQSDLRPVERVTGVYLRHDLAAQLRLIVELFPDRKRLAILHGDGRNEPLVRRAREMGRELGVTVIDRRLGSVADLSGFLRWVARDAELLWGLPDKLVYNAGTARSLLQASLRNRIPLLAPSATWAKAGAIVGLDWDFDDMGRQCAALLERMIDGGEGAPLPPCEAPRKLVWTCNENTARFMKIELPRSER